MNKLQLIAAASGLMVAGTAAQAVPLVADVVTLVDESGSMGGEHAWLPGMISSLESALVGAGVGVSPNQNNYAKVGYGGHVTGDVPHKHQENSLDWFASADYDNDFVASGGTEDGWRAIDFFFDNYGIRSNAAVNMILVTDEDRDNQDSTLTYNGILTQLTDANALLNAVVDVSISCDGASGSITALGMDGDGNGYAADGAGGFTLCSNAVATSAFGTTINDYVNLALASGGAAWDLKQLRSGGVTADSFTAAFIDIKVAEIQQQVPLPAPLSLMAVGLLGWRVARRVQSAS